jgi:hypothetical protein
MTVACRDSEADGRLCPIVLLSERKLAEINSRCGVSHFVPRTSDQDASVVRGGILVAEGDRCNRTSMTSVYLERVTSLP